MKGKVLKLLKTKYAKLGLSKETLEAMAATLELQLTEESSDEDIEAKVDGVENLLKSFQTEADRRATEAVSKAKSATDPKDDKAQDPPKGGEEKSDIAKAIAEAISPLVAEVAALKGEKVSTDRKQRLETALEKVDPKVKAKVLKDFGRMKFEKDEDFDAYLEETVEDLGDIASGDQTKPVGVPRPPKAGKSEAKPTDEEISSVVDSIM